MHCASCEVLIEKKLLKIKNVKSVKASTVKGEVLIVHKKGKLSTHKLNEIFENEGYTFFDQPPTTTNGFKTKEFLISFGR